MKKHGKLILVTAMTPTAAGVGKTTITVALGDALNRIGKKAVICWREPSFGPVFGVKGGAERVGRRKTTMLQNVEGGRATELGASLGAVRRWGDLTGTPALHIDTVYAPAKLLSTTKAAEWRRARGLPYAAGVRRGMHTKRLAQAAGELAPDGSQIRKLLALQGVSCVHCTLKTGQISRAMRHRSVDEIWIVLRGRGKLWRKYRAVENVDNLAPGLCAAIPKGVHFQFRNTGRGPLELVLCTVPPWSGHSEAVRVADHWPIL